MVQLHSFAASGGDTASVLDAIETGMPEEAVAARFVYAFYGCDHDDAAILAWLRDRYPYAAILGGTSCAGVMN